MSSMSSTPADNAVTPVRVWVASPAGCRALASAAQAARAANRQGQLINVLTVVATLFPPLTFLTGFFGMDFGVPVKNLNSTWAFVVLGLLLPAVIVAITLLLYDRLLRRFGVGKLTHPGSHA